MRVVKLLLAAVMVWAGVAHGAAVEGTDYLRINPSQSVGDPTKVEVVEFFWYGCPHCRALEPKLNAWKARLPANVVFKRVPVMWGDGHAKHAQVYYTLETLGLLNTLHTEVFDAVQAQGAYKDKQVELRDEGAFADWLAGKFVNRDRVLAVYRSYGVNAMLERARQMGTAYGVQGVPAFYVQGKYFTSPSQVKSEDRVFQVLDELIRKEAANLPKPAAVAKPVSAPAKPVAPAKPSAQKPAATHK